MWVLTNKASAMMAVGFGLTSFDDCDTNFISAKPFIQMKPPTALSMAQIMNDSHGYNYIPRAYHPR